MPASARDGVGTDLTPPASCAKGANVRSLNDAGVTSLHVLARSAQLGHLDCDDEVRARPVHRDRPARGELAVATIAIWSWPGVC
jgi:hypothetical protein